jgi:hypothetical protein
VAAPNWKKKTPRDKRFLRFLLNRPCELRHGRHGQCYGDMIYHHTSTGGISLKGSDYDAISACFGHHDIFDNAGKKGVGVFTEDQLTAIIAKNKADWIAEGNKLVE